MRKKEREREGDRKRREKGRREEKRLDAGQTVGEVFRTEWSIAKKPDRL